MRASILSMALVILVACATEDDAGSSAMTSEPADSVYPGESFAVLQIEAEEGIVFANVNRAYDSYPHKGQFPWCAQLLIELEYKNVNGHPTDQEAEVLNWIEDETEGFLRRHVLVHFIGRITRKDFREVIWYVDKSDLDQNEVATFFDEINRIRRVNFSLDEDADWKIVAGLIE